MEVILNGNSHLVIHGCTVSDLINELALDGKFAIEVNQTIVPRSQYTSTKINPGDAIEIVQAIGGG